MPGAQQPFSYRIALLHVTGWVLFLVIPVLTQTHTLHLEAIDWRLQLPDLVFNLLLIAFFYANMYYFIPVIRKDRGWLAYALTVLVAVAALLYVHALLWNTVPPPRGGMPFPGPGFRPRRGGPMGPPPDEGLFMLHGHHLTIVFSILLVFAISTILRFSMDIAALERSRQERETMALKSELGLLRSQISPHFMFNVLNSLAALARKKSDLLETVIIKLSSLMRYMLYEAGEARVNLETEMEYLQSYIDLQKLRFDETVHVSIDVQVQSSGLQIEPMLLIPFVENAFKHGTGVLRNPEIQVSAMVRANTLVFHVRNRFDPATASTDSAHGIGLQNVRRRLELLYPDRFELTAGSDGDWFTVSLALNLHS
ncbi:MAG: histidine kinase [Cyclobacteriaceae bacterium]